ncbi:hypothetical protein AX14_003473 [Amanita brunnescens Koide BX004]|nr:hypothetical protein AX14_003473 [Amanita brunnescens Koide BX004]
MPSVFREVLGAKTEQPPQISLSRSSDILIETPRALIPTTDQIAEECTRFRILIVGRSGVGKSTLINTIFEEGTVNINKDVIIHDSEGYGPRDVEKFCVLERFITERNQEEFIADRLHAIWLCITAPFTDRPLFQPWDEKIFELNKRKVPIIVVCTMFDRFMASLSRPRGANMGKGDGSFESAVKIFQEQYGQQFKASTKNVEGEIPYTVVARNLPETLQRLVDITMKNINASSPNLSSELGFRSTSTEEFLDPMQNTPARAQRVDMGGKINASINVGRKRYWTSIASGIYFLGSSLKKCLDVIHKDLVAIWNIRDMEEVCAKGYLRSFL